MDHEGRVYKMELREQKLKSWGLCINEVRRGGEVELLCSTALARYVVVFLLAKRFICDAQAGGQLEPE